MTYFKIMYIILVLLLLMRLNELRCNPLKSSKPLKSINTIEDTIEDTKNRYFWTINQLKRCYLRSRTLPHEERLDYLITLHRKISDVRHQRKELYNNYHQPFETKILHQKTANQLIYFRKFFLFKKSIGVFVFFGSLTIWNYRFIFIIT